MFEAQLLISKGATGYSVYSPWFPRGGNNLRASLDYVEDDGAVSAATVQVEVFTKKSDVTGDGSNANGAVLITANSAGRTTTEWTTVDGATNKATLEDMIRYKFTITSSDAGQWVLFRMLPPVWFDTVAT